VRARAQAKEFPPLQTCEGFFTYQGQTEAIQDGHTFITFKYNSSAGGNGTGAGATFPTASCCNFDPNSCYTWPGGNPNAPGCTTAVGNASSVNTSSPCSTCAGMCTGGVCGGGAAGGAADPFPGLGDVADDPLLGFDGATVGAVYGAIGAATVVITLLRARAGAAARAAGAGAGGAFAAGGSADFFAAGGDAAAGDGGAYFAAPADDAPGYEPPQAGALN